MTLQELALKALKYGIPAALSLLAGTWVGEARRHCQRHGRLSIPRRPSEKYLPSPRWGEGPARGEWIALRCARTTGFVRKLWKS